MPDDRSPKSDSIFPEPRHLSPEVQSSLRRYWRSNVKIMIALLFVWAAAGLGCGVLFADALNEFELGGYPLGFWFAQQGSILVFLFLIFFYAWRMNSLDRKHGVDEE